nr:unnamed protein product [Callosobruchus analis]
MNGYNSTSLMSLHCIVKVLWNHGGQLIILRLLTQVVADQVGSNKMQHDSGPGTAVDKHSIELSTSASQNITRNYSIDPEANWPLASETKSIVSSNSDSEQKMNIHKKMRLKVLYRFDIVNHDLDSLIIAGKNGHDFPRETKFSQSVLFRFVRNTFNHRKCVLSKSKLTELDNLIQNMLLNTTPTAKTTNFFFMDSLSQRLKAYGASEALQEDKCLCKFVLKRCKL